MTELFESVTINGMSLKNRFVRSATWEGLAGQDGTVTTALCSRLAELAENEVALIICGYSFVSPEGQSSPYQLAIYDDSHIPGIEQLAAAVHAAGGKIALQLVHAGRFSAPNLTGQLPMGPSEEETEGKRDCRAMDAKDISQVVSAFTLAASRAKRAGIDAVQLHAAHGFLLSQFLSPAFNKRTDDYGGSLENRARLLLEVARRVRESVGAAYPVLVKLNSEDFLDRGMCREESIGVARLLEGTVDAIELSGGTILSGDFIAPRPGKAESEVYYRDAARLYKQQVSIPLILVGGIRSFEVAQELVETRAADCIALSRPLIGEPDLIKRWRSGDRRTATCLSCNNCFSPAMEGTGIYCVPMGG